jgi:hypothetical protein
MANKHLTIPAAKLARAAPTEWEHFIEAVAAYAQQKATDLTQSPSGDTLHVAQGRAQAALDILTHLRSCKSDADREHK